MSDANDVPGRQRPRQLHVAMALMLGFSLAAPGLAAERFKRFSADEFRQRFSERTVGDEAHWSWRFARDGGVDAMDLGKTRRGIWRFPRGELCMEFTEHGKPTSECYEVWMSGKQVRFLRDGVLIVEGSLLNE